MRTLRVEIYQNALPGCGYLPTDGAKEAGFQHQFPQITRPFRELYRSSLERFKLTTSSENPLEANALWYRCNFRFYTGLILVAVLTRSMHCQFKQFLIVFSLIPNHSPSFQLYTHPADRGRFADLRRKP